MVADHTQDRSSASTATVATPATSSSRPAYLRIRNHLSPGTAAPTEIRKASRKNTDQPCF